MLIRQKDLTKSLNCGSCAGLLRERVIESNKCGEVGKLPSSKACNKHKPDVHALIQDKENRLESFVELGQVFAKMSANELQIFSALLNGERKTRRHGYKLFQKVYVRISGHAGKNYRSNFVLGYVLDASKDFVRVVSQTSRTMISVPNEKNSTTIYSVDRFEPIRKAFIENKWYTDPDASILISKLDRIADLDEADDAGALDTPVAARRKIKKQKQKEDLVSIVSKLSKGIIRTKKEDEQFVIGW